VGRVQPTCAVATPRTAVTASDGEIVVGDNAAPHCASPLLPTPQSTVRTRGVAMWRTGRGLAHPMIQNFALKILNLTN